MLDMLGLETAVREGSEVTVGPCDCVDVPREDTDILLEDVLDVLGESRAEYDCKELPDIDRHAEGVCVLAAVFVLRTEEEIAAV